MWSPLVNKSPRNVEEARVLFFLPRPLLYTTKHWRSGKKMNLRVNPWLVFCVPISGNWNEPLLAVSAGSQAYVGPAGLVVSWSLGQDGGRISLEWEQRKWAGQGHSNLQLLSTRSPSVSTAKREICKIDQNWPMKVHLGFYKAYIIGGLDI